MYFTCLYIDLQRIQLFSTINNEQNKKNSTKDYCYYLEKNHIK